MTDQAERLANTKQAREELMGCESDSHSERNSIGFNSSRGRLAIWVCSLLLLSCACKKRDEVAHPTPAQNAAMSNLDVIAKAPAEKPLKGRVSPSAP